VFYNIVICEQSFGQVSNADNSISQKQKKILISPDVNKKLKLNTQSSDLIKSKLKGIWTDGTTENAAFEIKENTIFYVDNVATYKYTLQGNKMTIIYPDYTYKCVISFHKDTLIMDSKEYGSSSFWKFKKNNR
jgi:hypothetical protein